MSTQACTNHTIDYTMQDDVVAVVYQANVPRLQPCPLCMVIKERNELNARVEQLEHDLEEAEEGL